jgi:hypothetical protein
MTDHDDKLKRAYRGLGNEEPPAALDAAILARARERVVPRRRPSWMVPVSIAAVLVLGIGVSLRMQLEQPGIESSVPAPAAVPERPAPATPAAPATTVPAASELARDSAAPVAAPEAKRTPQKKVDAFKQKERLDEARPRSNVAPAQAPAGAAQSREEKPVSAGAISAPRPPAPATTSVAAEPPPFVASPPAPAAAPAAAAPSLRLAPQTMQAPERAKREAESDAAPGTRDLRKSLVTPEADPVRELERIAQLRAEGRHAEADRALEEFRRSRPDYRIPEAVWERVKPR